MHERLNGVIKDVGDNALTFQDIYERLGLSPPEALCELLFGEEIDHKNQSAQGAAELAKEQRQP